MTRVDLYVVVFRLRLMMGTYAMPKELVLSSIDDGYICHAKGACTHQY